MHDSLLCSEILYSFVTLKIRGYFLYLSFLYNSKKNTLLSSFISFLISFR